MSGITTIKTFHEVSSSVRRHCESLGLSEVRTVACESTAVSLLTAGRSPASAIGEAKQQAERYSACPRAATWKQPSVNCQGVE